MAKPPPGPCVHCFENYTELTWDHVFPLSWYPDSAPDDLERWKVPACAACNVRLSKLEESLLQRLALCLDPKSPAASGLLDRVRRSFDPSAARNARDRGAREATRRKLQQELFTFEQLPTRILPGFGGTPRVQGFVAIRIYDDELHAIIQKIVKGLAYRIEGVLLDGAFRFHYFPVEDSGNPEVERLLSSGLEAEWGPGLRLRRVVAEADAPISLTRIDIWERLNFYVAVERLIVFPGA